MNRRLRQYPLALKALQKVTMPIGGRDHVLCVRRAGDDVVLWTIVDIDETRLDRVTVLIVGTSHDLPDRCTKGSYVGTVDTIDGVVAHVFIVGDIGETTAADL